MRRSIAVFAVAVTTTLASAVSLAPAGAVAPVGSPRVPLSGALGGTDPHQVARAALDRVQDLLDGTPASLAPEQPAAAPDLTLAMRDLYASLPDLGPAERTQARSVLARPTDGADDEYGDGYRASALPAKKRCRGHFCVHWVTSSRDKSSSAQVDQTLRTMNAVWKFEVTGLGYRRPVSDGHRGGKRGMFDVYLSQLADDGLYGYCAPEYLKPGRKRESDGYCVLDNNYTDQIFGGAAPRSLLRVTAAHEFFHAVQFGYDYLEDYWLMEATSTWMEERFADGVDDNRQYLPAGQVHQPGIPLDTFDPYGAEQYGNWVFFEFLSSRYGNAAVRQVWNQAGQFPGAGMKYSTQAVRAVLGHHGGFGPVFARYAAGNTVPGRTYAEGNAWPSARIAKKWRLGRGHRSDSATLSIDHMASKNVRLKPAAGLGKAWRAKVVVNGPGRASAPQAYLIVVRKHGKPVKRAVKLDGHGRGHTSIEFGHEQVKRAIVTLGNASTRFECNKDGRYSCLGKALDQNRRFKVEVKAVRR